MKCSVRAAREQGDQYHQVRQCEQPLICLLARRFRSPRDKAQMSALRKIADVVHADASQAGDLRISENLLARFYGNHGLVPLTVCHTAYSIPAPKPFDASCSVRDARF